MFAVAVLVFPFGLLALMLAMERVERPLDTDRVSLELDRFLDSAVLDVKPDEVEAYVAEGYASALDRYWRRRRQAGRRRPRTATPTAGPRPATPPPAAPPAG